MSKLEDLTNEQLQKKLQEYGLVNMPVTQTTRAVLIKRLKKKVEETDSKVRRETVHVVKYSSDEDSEKTEAVNDKKSQKKEPNRRATIGVSAAKLSKDLPVLPKLPPPKPVVTEKPIEVSQKRRSGRVTPVQQNNKDTAAAVPKEPMIVEDSDDDEDLPLTQLQRRDRSSKSPSLSRAETVTTSYVHQVEITSKPPIVEEMEVDLTESVDESEKEPEQEPYRRPVVTPSRESRLMGGSSTITSTRTTIAGTPGLSLNRPQPELSTSFGRPSMATSYNYNSPLREERKLDPSDSPYLSEFTKRLSRLKAETAQINASREVPMRRTMVPSYASTSRTSDGSSDYVRLPTAVRGRYDSKGAATGKGELRASLRQVILSLDQKFPIKRIFYLLIVAMIVIFLFVFFFL
ncbi:LEM domain-containing protein Bocksbeutel-like [Sabethes cyaneus]|uniref:LEM domain-containing protein Bocksbeutel-like n=1 Tax=Sabethes cyaneus TaxID=53552 RepID=UPI00237E22FC|nr:LEM domain-containing protein Bocksbeutel-like [Sabethes cyaneus]